MERKTMEKNLLCCLQVSRIGIGGHYKAKNEGAYDELSAYVDREVEKRIPLVEKALKAGVNYFDTTCRNEVVMLAKILEHLHARDRVVVNGMVVGAFSGSKATDETIEAYFNKELDVRLETMSGHRFDTFMINAIEEEFDPQQCERLVKLLEQRRAAGDFRVSVGDDALQLSEPCI